MTRPGYKRITANDSHYVYDTSTNAVVSIPASVNLLLDDYFECDGDTLKDRYAGELSPEEYSEAIGFIEHAINESGMFQPFFHKDYSAVLSEGVVEAALSGMLGDMVLAITHECNQRCSYCLYSGRYEGHRTHASDEMSWEVAKSSIDYFMERRDRAKKVHISFYGGEPMLRWDFITRCITYTRKTHSTENLGFQVTSNITMMSEEIMNYLIDNDVLLYVSLDGPQAVHDAARALKGGGPTHETVMTNLDAIRKSNPDYFQRQVCFNVTYTRHNDLLEIFDFFNREPFFDHVIMLNAIKPGGTGFEELSEEEKQRYTDALGALTDRYSAAVRENGKFNYGLYYNIFRNMFTRVIRRKTGYASENTHPCTTCMPGVRKLFVDVDGTFYPCERLHPPSMAIGDCCQGIDVDRSRDLLKVFVDFCDQKCQECWAYRICSQCLVHFLDKGVLSIDEKEKNCFWLKKRIARDLERFVYLWNLECEHSVDSAQSLHGLVREPPEH